jgi:hypothetical protein
MLGISRRRRHVLRTDIALCRNALFFYKVLFRLVPQHFL